MSGLATRSHEQATEQTPATTTEVAPATEAPASNAEQQEKLRDKKGTAEGKASYEGLLGKWLGGELYKAIAPHLTFEALQGYANDGLGAALEGGVGALGELDGEIDKGAIKKFGEALSQQYGGMAGKWLDTDGGKKLTGGLANWVDTNPELIVLIGLLAAAGAILADMDVPKIKEKFKIAKGLTAEVEAELGSLRDLALEEVKAKLSYSSGPLIASVQMTHKDEGGQGYKAEIGVAEKDSYSIKADLEMTDDGFKAYGVSGMLNTDVGKLEGGVTQKADKDPVITGKITQQDGSVTKTNEVAYDANSGVFTFKNAMNAKLDGGGSVSTNMGMGSDGTSQVGANVSMPITEHLTGTAGISETTAHKDDGLATTTNVSGGLQYANKANGLNASLDGKYASDGTGSLTGKGTWKPSDNFSLNANAQYNFGADQSYKLGGGFDYNKGPNRVMGSAAYNSTNSQFDANLMGQRYLTDDFALRGTAGFKSNNEGNSYNFGLQGAYFLNKDVALIGGGQYMLDNKGQSSFMPQVGAQVKGIPLTVGYDTGNKGWVIGATLKF